MADKEPADLITQLGVLADICLAQGTEIRTLRDLMDPITDLVPFLVSELPDNEVRRSLETWAEIAKKLLAEETSSSLLDRQKRAPRGFRRKLVEQRLQRHMGLSAEAAQAKGLLLFPKGR